MSEKKKRRRAGEGSIREYETTQGKRYMIVYRVTDPETGERRQRWQRGFTTEGAATKELRKRLAKADAGEYVEPSREKLGKYLDMWLAGLRHTPSTVASYRKNIRLHIKPALGGTPLAQITGPQLTRLYRQLEESGRRDGREGGLSARTVRYIHTIIHKALGDAVKAGMLPVNPADRASPPSAKQAQPPEMTVWPAEQLARFLGWAAERHADLATAWALMAATGARRGEALALRWADVDLDKARISVRRSATLIKRKGQGESIVEGPTKSGNARNVDVDPATVALLRRHRAHRAGLDLRLATPDALVFGRPTGQHLHPERFSRRFANAVRQARDELGADLLPVIRLHDLRHTHASLLLAAGVPVKELADRLGHTKPTITLSVYAHVIPSMSQSASRWSELMSGAAR
jgi:integrase